MNRLGRIIGIILIATSLSCTQEADLAPSELSTFIKLKGESAYRLTAVDAVITSQENTIILANAIDDNGDSYPYLIEIDKNGTTVWSNVLINNPGISYSMALIDDETLAIAGESEGSIQVLITNINSSSVSESYHITDVNDPGYSLRAKAITYDNTSGNLIVVGEKVSQSNATLINTIMYSFDQSLVPQLIKVYSSNKNYVATSLHTIEEGADIKVYWTVKDPTTQKSQLISAILGENEEEGPFLPSNFSFEASNFIPDNDTYFGMIGSSNNSMSFVYTNIETGYNKVSFLKPSSNGSTIAKQTSGYFLVGGTYNGEASNGGDDYLLSIIDNAGNTVIEKIYGGENSDRLKKIVSYQDGRILLIGDTLYGNVRTLLLIKTNPQGELE